MKEENIKGEYQRKVDKSLIPTCNIMGVNIAAINMNWLLKYIDENLSDIKGDYICVSNVHTTVNSYENAAYCAVQNGGLMAIPDGGPLSSVGRKRGYSDMDRTTGPSMMGEIFKISAEKGYRHYFYGSTEETLKLLEEKLQANYPGIQIAGMYSPPFRPLTEEEDKNIIENINKIKPDFVWIGLGAPKQEKWMAEHQGKIDAISALGISSFAAGAVSFFVQHATLQSIIQTAYSGYTTTIEEGVLQSILNRGGMGSMLQYVAIISFAVGMGGMLEKLGVLEHILNAVVKRINSDGSMILVTLIVGYITSLISCSQPMSHVLTGRLMAPVFKERKVAPEILSRCLEDSGTMAGPMIPWHGYGVYMAGTLGVAWSAFFPYLFLLYLTPIFSIIYGFTGISIKHVSGEEVAE